MNGYCIPAKTINPFYSENKNWQQKKKTKLNNLKSNTRNNKPFGLNVSVKEKKQNSSTELKEN